MITVTERARIERAIDRVTVRITAIVEDFCDLELGVRYDLMSEQQSLRVAFLYRKRRAFQRWLKQNRID